MTAFIGYLHSLKRNRSNKSINQIPFKFVKKYINLHLKATQLQIASENKQKSAIYLIYNNINGKYYIGSAGTNRINLIFL